VALPDRHRRVRPGRRAQSPLLRLGPAQQPIIHHPGRRVVRIIDASHILGRGWFLLDVQAHKQNSDPELVEGGQLLALFVDPRIGDDRRGRHEGKHDDKHRDDDEDND